jgi:hypothetical protein
MVNSPSITLSFNNTATNVGNPTSNTTPSCQGHHNSGLGFNNSGNTWDSNMGNFGNGSANGSNMYISTQNKLRIAQALWTEGMSDIRSGQREDGLQDLRLARRFVRSARRDMKQEREMSQNSPSYYRHGDHFHHGDHVHHYGHTHPAEGYDRRHPVTDSSSNSDLIFNSQPQGSITINV